MIRPPRSALLWARPRRDRCWRTRGPPCPGRTFVAVAAVLAMITLAASAGPAIRASRTEPAEALRAE